MKKTSSDPLVTELTNLFRKMFLGRPHSKASIPETILKLKKDIEQAAYDNPLWNVFDFDLVMNISMNLANVDNPITMGELSRSLDVPLSTATRIVDLLFKLGYAERFHDTNDRRVVRVRLTDAGNAVCRAVEELAARRVQFLVRHFTPEELGTMVSLLKKLILAMDEEQKMESES